MELLTELHKNTDAINNIRENNRTSEQFNHLSAVSEGIVCLGWITAENRPTDIVGDMLGGAQFYGNRVLKEYKDK